MDFPRRFGRYELLDHVATGGMAEVYRARSFGVEGFERQICIKRILPGLSRDPRFVSMFVKEARICSGLAHPNIVQIYELGRVGDDHYMAMEYVHGRDLGRILRTMRRCRTPMPVGVAVHVVVEALRGLGCAHGLCDADGQPLGVVHRDISPHNILVGFEGETKVFDFGVAQLGDARVGTQGGGKLAYMAPEQARGGPIDHRCDLYAMGVVLYELLAGRRPTDSAAARSELAAAQRPPDIRHERPEVPAAIAETVQQLMSLQPSGRPASAHEAADRLRSALFDAGIHTHSGHLRQFLARLVPDSHERAVPGSVDLGGLASDVAHLGRSGPAASTHSGIGHTPSGNSAPPPGGRRPVVVVVAEVVGLTDATTSLESEHIFRRHLRLLRHAWRVVEAHDGTIEGWQDDTLTVVFGLPRARGHDVERALACAEALVGVARALPAVVGRVELCVGVHQGEISVGATFGRRHRYVAHGDTVKLARHLSMVADPGEVLVSPHVARLGKRRFDFAEGPALRRRSAVAGARAWRLGRRRDRESVHSGRWVARSQELQVVSRALALLAEGRGSRLAVLGPAGSGKSRLLREVMELARRRGARVVGVRGLPYGSGGTPRILHDLVRAILGLEDGPAASSVDLDERLVRSGLEPDERAALHRLVAGGQRPTPGARRRNGAVEAVAALMRELSRTQPVIVAVEDVQYLDASEHRLLRDLLRGVPDRPVLWWLTARDALPEALRPADRSIHLDRLPSDRVRALAIQLLGARDLGPALWRALSRTAEGNPLYVESIVGALSQAGRVVTQDGVARLRDPGAEVRLPPGLDALIAERVDALEPALRGLLQLAVTIGPRFSLRLLGEAAGLADPAPLVTGLVAQRLVVWVGDRSDGHCAVASTLIGQVVQRSLLGAQRRSCHRAVAAAIARLNASDLTPHRVSLATHCAGAGDFLDAARHGARAGQWFMGQQLLDQATRAFEGALRHIASGRQAGMELAQCAHAEAVVRADLGTCLSRSGSAEAAERHLRIALDLSADLLLPEIEATAHLELGRLLGARGDGALAVAHLEAAYERAQMGQPHDSTGPGWRVELAVRALEALAIQHDEAGDPTAARRCLELARTRAANDVQLLGRVWLALARPALRAGEEQRGRQLLSEALECARAAGDRILEGKVHNNFGILHHAAGRYDTAIEYFEAARGLREGLGYRRGAAINLHNIGDTWLRRGELGRAWAAFTDSRAIADRLGWQRGKVMNDLFLTHLRLMRVEADDTLVAELLGRQERFIASARALGDGETAVTGLLLLARGQRRAGALEAAARVLEQALHEAERLDARVLARDLRLEQAALASAATGMVRHTLPQPAGDGATSAGTPPIG